MAVVYYPNRVQKGVVPAIDRVMAKRNPQIINNREDISVGAIDFRFSANADWQLDSVAFTFSDATARDYTVSVMNGRKVLTDLNDSLWFQIDATGPESITLDSGFYTGTELAAELQIQLNANSSFIAAGVTFTVSYNSITGLYTITPSSGTIKYFNVNSAQVLSLRDSIAGHLFGLNATTGFVASIASDTPVKGLDSEAAIISQTGSVVLQHYHDDLHTLTLDQALHITTNVANLTADYSITYEELNNHEGYRNQKVF